MNVSRREFLRLSAVAAAATATGLGITWSGAMSVANSSPELHLLKRVGWGVRPGDIELLKGMGLEAYLENQLHPRDLARSCS